MLILMIKFNRLNINIILNLRRNTYNIKKNHTYENKSKIA